MTSMANETGNQKLNRLMILEASPERLYIIILPIVCHPAHVFPRYHGA